MKWGARCPNLRLGAIAPWGPPRNACVSTTKSNKLYCTNTMINELVYVYDLVSMAESQLGFVH